MAEAQFATGDTVTVFPHGYPEQSALATVMLAGGGGG